MEIFKEIIQELKNGNFEAANNNIIFINDTAMELLNLPDETIKSSSSLLDRLEDIIIIGNITYNYGDTERLPIDDGIYDLLVEKLKRIDYNRFTPGAVPVFFDTKKDDFKPILEKNENEMIKPFIRMSDEEAEKFKDAFFPSILDMTKPYDPRCYMEKPF